MSEYEKEHLSVLESISFLQQAGSTSSQEEGDIKKRRGCQKRKRRKSSDSFEEDDDYKPRRSRAAVVHRRRSPRPRRKVVPVIGLLSEDATKDFQESSEVMSVDDEISEEEIKEGRLTKLNDNSNEQKVTVDPTLQSIGKHEIGRPQTFKKRGLGKPRHTRSRSRSLDDTINQICDVDQADVDFVGFKKRRQNKMKESISINGKIL